jgi:hypothetical protein
MEQDLLIRGLSPLTREAYLRAVVGLTKYYGRAPDTLSEQDVQAYLASLIKERGLAWNTLNVTVHGLRFFYAVTLGRSRTHFSIPTAKTPATQPQILSRQEVARLLDAVPNRKHRTLHFLPKTDLIRSRRLTDGLQSFARRRNKKCGTNQRHEYCRWFVGVEVVARDKPCSFSAFRVWYST